MVFRRSYARFLSFWLCRFIFDITTQLSCRDEKRDKEEEEWGEGIIVRKIIRARG